MKNILITLAIALVLPIGVAYGAQPFITQINLSNTYQTKIEKIDADILRLQSSLVVKDPKKSWTYNISIEDGHNLEIHKSILQLREDRRILEVAYELLNESF